MLFLVMILLAIGILCFLFTIAITKDMKCILKTIARNFKTKRRRKLIFMQFIEFIDLHAATKQLSCVPQKFPSIWNCSLSINNFSPFSIVCDFSKLYQPILVTLFLRDILSTCCGLLIFQMELVEYKLTCFPAYRWNFTFIFSRIADIIQWIFCQ